MGFNDEQRNINALMATGGNVAAAVQYLIDNNGNTNNNSNKNNSNENSDKQQQQVNRLQRSTVK